MFKVVTDQLKVSQGWVRCGHCSEVFDASLHLTTAPASAPVLVAPSSEPAAPSVQTFPPVVAMAATPVFAADTVQAESESVGSSASMAAVQPEVPVPKVDGFVAPPDVGLYAFNPAGWSGPQRPPSEASNSPPVLEPALQTKIADTTDTADTSATGSALGSISAPPSYGFDDAHEVSFVRDARRQALWRKPAVRVALALFGLLFGFVLFLQVVVQQRDAIAARQSTFKPWLQLLCSYLHCELGPVRRIESVVIDSSAFNKINNDSYRLSFSLKNTGATPVAMPALEVTLTDTQDQALFRRVLVPTQFGAANRLLIAGADFSGVVLIRVAGQDASPVAEAPVMAPPASAPLSLAANPLRVAGYRVLAFYP